MTTIDLSQYELHVENIQHNPAPATPYQDALRSEPDSALSDSGALIAYSGSKTGRSPKDKRIVRSAESENEVWWGR